ncbi:MAG: acyl carrier protein [Pseudonocardiaceae bacterium]
MESTVEKSEIVEDLRAFVEEEILRENSPDLDSETPLLELGILNSLSMARMIAFIRERYGLFVPAEKIIGSNFRSLDQIAELVMVMNFDPHAHV